jgi:hypothetical protein
LDVYYVLSGAGADGYEVEDVMSGFFEFNPLGMLSPGSMANISSEELYQLHPDGIRNIMGVPYAEIQNVSVQPYDLGEKDYSLVSEWPPSVSPSLSPDWMLAAKQAAAAIQQEVAAARQANWRKPPAKAAPVQAQPPLKTRRAISLTETP